MDITKNGSKAMKQQSGIVKEEQVPVKKVQKNSQLEKNNVKYKTYFHCINCNTDIFRNTEAFYHLGKGAGPSINDVTTLGGRGVGL